LRKSSGALSGHRLDKRLNRFGSSCLKSGGFRLEFRLAASLHGENGRKTCALCIDWSLPDACRLTLRLPNAEGRSGIARISAMRRSAPIHFTER
jgi:hypothetical protein